MIYVTGGTGLLGSHLLVELTKEQSSIRATYRSKEKRIQTRQLFKFYYPEDWETKFAQIEWVKGDILDVPFLLESMQDCEYIYHCAALVSFHKNDFNRLIKINREGTANIVNACLELNVKKLCYVSSTAAIGSSTNSSDDLISEKRLENFYAAINQSYTNYDDQLKMSQRAMIISSDELFQANKKLKEDAEIQKGIIENLNYIVRILKLGETSEHELDLDGKVDLAKFIKKQSKEILKINKQREELLANLEFKNQELNNYAHIVSHDLKSPLRSIHSLVYWILENENNIIDEESNNHFQLILKNVEKMDAMINGILNYSTIDKAEVEKYDVDIQYLVSELKEVLLIPENIQLTVHENLPILFGDKYRLQQVFQNLLQNAIKSIDKINGEVEVGVLDKNHFWEFYIKDNGKGIAEKYHKKIFEIFQSIDVEQNTTGIGLSIVKRIVEFYGGEIWLTSELTKGTTFYFTIPKNIK